MTSLERLERHVGCLVAFVLFVLPQNLPERAHEELKSSNWHAVERYSEYLKFHIGYFPCALEYHVQHNIARTTQTARLSFVDLRKISMTHSFRYHVFNTIDAGVPCRRPFPSIKLLQLIGRDQVDQVKEHVDEDDILSRLQHDNGDYLIDQRKDNDDTLISLTDDLNLKNLKILSWTPMRNTL